MSNSRTGRWVARVGALALGLTGSVGLANWRSDAPPTPVLDEVLVTGERPGPGMWRISKGGHDLWVLATLEPLPKDMVWRSQAVEERIALSQVVLPPPKVDTDIGFFRGLLLVPSMLRARNNPDGKTLQEELPHELYMRWLALRVKYLGHGDGDEKLRPMIAAYDIYTHALAESGLISDDGVLKVVEETAAKHKVKVSPVTVTLHISDPKSAIGALKGIPSGAEVECLKVTIERLETDLQPMRQRANLWSLGDVAGLRAQNYPNEQIACLDAVYNVPELRDQFERARAQLSGAWLTAADDALDRNESTFAVLPIGEFLRPDGLLSKLRARGYSVQEPP
jgi:hypothetical protein